MSVTDELLANNERYADEASTLLPSPPAKRVAVITCMDARIDVYRLLGLEKGDAHVIRNAGAVITDDVLRSLAISQRLLGTQEVIVILHSECGLLAFDAEAFDAGIESETGVRPTWPQFSIADLETDAKAAVEKIRALPYLPHTGAVRGFVVELATGKLHEAS
jgi:carbonic anhydrase